MKDLFSKYPATVAFLLLALVFGAVQLGCQPTTTSLLTGEQVTEAEFEREVKRSAAEIRADMFRLDADLEALTVAAEQTREELAQKKLFWLQAFDMLEATVVTSAGPYAPLAMLGLGGLAGALGIDNRRKDGVIKGNKMALDRVADAVSADPPKPEIVKAAQSLADLVDNATSGSAALEVAKQAADRPLG